MARVSTDQASQGSILNNNKALYPISSNAPMPASYSVPCFHIRPSMVDAALPYVLW